MDLIFNVTLVILVIFNSYVSTYELIQPTYNNYQVDTIEGYCKNFLEEHEKIDKLQEMYRNVVAGTNDSYLLESEQLLYPWCKSKNDAEFKDLLKKIYSYQHSKEDIDLDNQSHEKFMELAIKCVHETQRHLNTKFNRFYHDYINEHHIAHHEDPEQHKQYGIEWATKYKFDYETRTCLEHNFKVSDDFNVTKYHELEQLLFQELNKLNSSMHNPIITDNIGDEAMFYDTTTPNGIDDSTYQENYVTVQGNLLNKNAYEKLIDRVSKNLKNKNDIIYMKGPHYMHQDVDLDPETYWRRVYEMPGFAENFTNNPSKSSKKDFDNFMEFVSNHFVPSNVIKLTYQAGTECPRIHDGHHCWPKVRANTSVILPCPTQKRENVDKYINGYEPHLKDMALSMVKICNENGQWLPTDFTCCKEDMKEICELNFQDKQSKNSVLATALNILKPLIFKCREQGGTEEKCIQDAVIQANLSDIYYTTTPANYEETEDPKILDSDSAYLGNQTWHVLVYKKLIKSCTFILVFTSALSMVSCIISLILFCKFKEQLKCTRVFIHSNLFISFIIYHLTTIFEIMFKPLQPMEKNVEFKHVPLDSISLCRVYQNLNIHHFKWGACLSIHYLYVYSHMANYAWMLNEAIFIHYQITAKVFTDIMKTSIFYLIGWIAPLMFLLPLMYLTKQMKDKNIYNINKEVLAGNITYYEYRISVGRYSCHNINNPYEHIFSYIPITVALLINLLVLVHIIIVVIKKSRVHQKKNKVALKALKATIMLLPLFGLNQLLLIHNPFHNQKNLYDGLHIVCSITGVMRMLIHYRYFHLTLGAIKVLYKSFFSFLDAYKVSSCQCFTASLTMT